MSSVDATDVLIVGGGPTGLICANLLGACGVRVVLAEKNSGTSDDAKAISLDGESLRTLQMAGLDDVAYEVVTPGTGTRYYRADNQPLVHARGPEALRYGHPFKSSFAQPELEKVLRAGLERFADVTVLFGTEVTALEKNDDLIDATLRSPRGDRNVTAAWVLGCDGGRSMVREWASIPMAGESFQDVWLVADVTGDWHDERYGMHHADPTRPHVIVPGRDGRCRYEFLLRSGEGSPGEQPSFDLIQELVRPYRDLDPHQVERAVSYRFHALLADRFRSGRMFLLGDAAHMMPPFAGQGLNSGVRDAANLCWKITEVVAGRASEELLDTYELERRPQARAAIDFSTKAGKVVMTTSPARAFLRDSLVRAALLTSRGRDYFTQMRFRPANRFSLGAVVHLNGESGQELVGRGIPQPFVFRGRKHERVRLDPVLGSGLCVLGVDVPAVQWALLRTAGFSDLEQIEVALGDRTARDESDRAVICDVDGKLQAALGVAGGSFVVVRPDRVVAAVFPLNRAGDVHSALCSVGIRLPESVSSADVPLENDIRTRSPLTSHATQETSS